MRIFLVRHGQSEGNINKAKYFEKLDCDIELTDQGKADAINAARKIMDISDYFQKQKQLYPTPLDTTHFNLYHSPYTRAIQTASILSDHMESFHGYRINEYREDPRLREREWGGLRDIVTSGEKNEGHFNFYYRPVGGESFANTYDRVASFDQWLVANSKYENNIIVGHGEFNKLYCMYKLGWTVKEFDKWKTPRNGEVMLIENGELSSLTPLTLKIIKH